MAQADTGVLQDDEKDVENPWVEVFTALGKKTNVDEKVKTVTDWGLEIMDMLQADKQDIDALCEQLGLEGPYVSKFRKAIKKALIKYSEWSFLRDTLSEEKQADQLIEALNVVEKPSSMITEDDLKFGIHYSHLFCVYSSLCDNAIVSDIGYCHSVCAVHCDLCFALKQHRTSYRKICEECKVNVGDVRNVIGWYKTLQPLIAQTKDTITAAMVTEKIKQLYNAFDLPFFAMEEADDEDIAQLAGELQFDEEQTKFFKNNVASQLKLQGLMTQIITG